jgi:hypothetical protein
MERCLACEAAGVATHGAPLRLRGRRAISIAHRWFRLAPYRADWALIAPDSLGIAACISLSGLQSSAREKDTM